MHCFDIDEDTIIDDDRINQQIEMEDKREADEKAVY